VIFIAILVEKTEMEKKEKHAIIAHLVIMLEMDGKPLSMLLVGLNID
jgi:hypothetical protein